MTAPMRPDQPPRGPFDAVGFAKAARKEGLPLEEVVRILRDEGQGQYAKELERVAKDTWGNFGSRVAYGTGMGLGNAIAAGAGTAVQKLSGDARPVGTIYGQLKTDADNRERAYRDANPGKALLGDATGGVLSSLVVPGGRAAAGATAAKTAGKTAATAGRLFQRATQPFGNATWAGRAGNAAVLGGEMAGTSGAINAEGGLGERAKQGLLEGLVGAGLGFGLSAGLDGGKTLVKGGYQMLPETFREGVAATADNARQGVSRRLGAVAEAVAPRGDEASPLRRILAGTARGAANATAPAAAEPGLARVINRLQKQGMTIKDLERLSQQADGPDILAELIGQRGIDDLNATRNLGNTAPDQIRKALDERAANEADRWLATLDRMMPTPTVDPGTYRATRMAAAEQTAGPLYRQSQPNLVPPDATAGVMARLRRLRDDGIDVWKLAKASDEGMPPMPAEDELPTLTVAQWQRLRQVTDKLGKYGETEAPAYAIERQAIERLRSIRDEIDDLAKGAGGEPFVQADAAIASGEGASESFSAGYRAAQMARSGDEVQRLLQGARDPEAFRQGIAAYRQQQVMAVRDGAAGAVQNPFAPAVASERSRMITKAGLRDPNMMPEVERLAESGANRLSTRNQVLGGSPTAQRAASMAENIDGMPVNPLEAVTNPAGTASRGLSALWDGARRRVLGDEMDAYSNILLSGAPGRMPRELMLQRLQSLYPVLESQWAQEVLRRGRAGQMGAEAVGGRR